MRDILSTHAQTIMMYTYDQSSSMSKTHACVGLVQTYTFETQHKCEPNKHIRHKMNACAKKYDTCVGIVMYTFETLTYVSENQRMCQVRTHNNV